jgi:hypothetical protein
MKTITTIRIIVTTDNNGIIIPEVPKTPIINTEIQFRCGLTHIKIENKSHNKFELIKIE